jgi:hypothetical protein
MAHLRLTGLLKQAAVAELTQLLEEQPRGLRRNDLQGTNKFHGMRTLTPNQIRACLKSIPNISYWTERFGLYARCYWFIKGT